MTANTTINIITIMKKIRFLYLVVLLLMAALGAKADPLAVTSDDIGKLICTDGSIYATQDLASDAGKTAVAESGYRAAGACCGGANKKGCRRG